MLAFRASSSSIMMILAMVAVASVTSVPRSAGTVATSE